MTLNRLVLRTFRHFAVANSLAVVCLALSSAIICGSLIVGRSMRETLRASSLARLGVITDAVVSMGSFHDDLADHISGPIKGSAAVLMVHGTVATDSQEVAPDVNIIGVDPTFGAFYPGQAVPTVSDRNIAINNALADVIGAREGDDVIVTMARNQSAPLDTLFAHRTREGAIVTMRLHVAQLLAGSGPGGFGLDSATLPIRLNLFVAGDTLAWALGKSDVANTLLLKATGRVTLHATAEDCGLRLTPDFTQRCVSVSSDRLLLRDAEVASAFKTAGETGGTARRVSVFLADSIHDVTSGKSISYAVVAATEGDEPNPGGMRLNRWAAADLSAHSGDLLRVDCLVPSSAGAYSASPFTFHTASVVSTVDSTLTPQFEGITDAVRISDWKPPFPVDLSRVTARDDDYWAKYRAAPRAFVSGNDARKYWALGPGGEKTGWVTSIRITPPKDESLAAYETRFATCLSRNLSPAASGLSLRPVRLTALKAVEESTDFGDLFLSLGIFVILAAAGAAATLMRIAVDRRAAQIGLLKAIGLPNAKIVRVIVSEGFLIAAIGAILGAPLGALYAAGLLWALSGPWSPAASGVVLSLHATPGDMIAGVASGMLVGLVATVVGVWRVLKTPALTLLVGSASVILAPMRRSGLQAAGLGAITTTVVVLLVFGRHASEEAFFAIGFLLLIAGLLAADIGFGRPFKKSQRIMSLSLVARRNLAVNRGQSLLVLGLVATSSFLLVAVAANTRRFTQIDAGNLQSGAGGFELVATSSLPMPGDFSTDDGRVRLGFSPQDEDTLRGSTIFGLLASPGDEASCLNLAHPMAPKMLAVSHALIERGGFGARWTDLEHGDETPAFADADTAHWILNTDIGQTFPYRNGSVATNLRIVGLIPGSIFAGELLVSEDRFRDLFPNERTPRFFLIQTPPGQEAAVADVLRRNLGALGLDVRKSSDLLNAVSAVQNTYISAFVALGSLGMLLGTGVLAVMLLRSARERRKELALLSAIGLSARNITTLLLLETVGLLVLGVLWGALCALVSVTPYLMQSSAAPNWATIAALLAAVMLTGIAACFAAGQAVARGPMIAALRSE